MTHRTARPTRSLGQVPWPAYALDRHAESVVDWRLFDSDGNPRGERLRYSTWRAAVLLFLERYGDAGNRAHYQMCMSQYMTIAGEHARFGGWRPER